MRRDSLDTRLRAAICADLRIRFALAYGSRTQLQNNVRQDDEYSDLEYYIYLRPGQEFDARSFVESVTPVVLAVTNTFGTLNFVTPELHRIELHIEQEERLAELLGWSVLSPEIARMLVKDSGDRLATLLAQFAAQPDWRPEVQQITVDRILNALVAIRGFLLRGERLRAYEWQALWVVGGLTRLARHAEAKRQPPAPGHWAERDLSAGMLNRLNECAPGISEPDRSSPEHGFRYALKLCGELARELGLDERPALREALHAFSPAAVPPSGD